MFCSLEWLIGRTCLMRLCWGEFSIIFPQFLGTVCSIFVWAFSCSGDLVLRVRKICYWISSNAQWYLTYRPGRLEVHIEINLPDENGRFQILQIHTNKMKENSFLSPDVNLQELGMCCSFLHFMEIRYILNREGMFHAKLRAVLFIFLHRIQHTNVK
jgi:hypothetical protein